MSLKAYIAGKITGDTNYKDKFADAADMLTIKGYTVLNPSVWLPEALSWEDCLRICLSMIDIADEIYFLPDWYESHGARVEMSYCRKAGKTVHFLSRTGQEEYYAPALSVTDLINLDGEAAYVAFSRDNKWFSVLVRRNTETQPLGVSLVDVNGAAISPFEVWENGGQIFGLRPSGKPTRREVVQG